MTARAAFAAALLVVAGSTLAVAGVQPVDAQPALGSDPPEETEDGATFTVSTQSIDLHQGGTICARKVAPDVNEVTITDATMNGVELYLGDDEEPKKVEAESADVDEIVLYTNGENDLVNLLALTGACIPLDQPQQTVIEVYYQEAGTLEMNGFQMVTGGTEAPPEPGGLTLPDSILNGSEDDGEQVENASKTVDRTTEAVENATDAVGETTEAVNRTTDAVDETTNAVNETTENVTETVDRVENPTETVDGTLETVNETTDRVEETAGGATDTVNETVDRANDTTDRTTETVDGATDEVEDVTTAAGDTVEETGDAATDPSGGTDDAVDRTGDTVGETGEAVENTTGDVEDTAGDTQETAQDTADSATDTVGDTTTEVQDTAEEVVPPAAGFGIGENVPLVGDPVTLDASGSSDDDGAVEKYEWDVDGDGNYEKTGQRVTHAFPEPGEQEVTLRVTDDDGATDTATKTVRVNAPPNAAFSIVSDLLTIGEPIDLDATGSSDPDGEVAKYEWDLDGDGDFEESGATPSPTFPDLGEQEVTLRVTDDDGATDTATKTLDLTESDDGGLLGGGSTDDGGTASDSGGSSTDDGDDTSIIGAILP